MLGGILRNVCSLSFVYLSPYQTVLNQQITRRCLNSIILFNLRLPQLTNRKSQPMKSLIALFLTSTLIVSFSQSPCLSTEYDNSQATYYVDLLPGESTGNCSFANDSVIPNYAALHSGMYNGPGGSEPAKWCGVCLEVTGQIGTETIQVVDQCPTCAHSIQDLDLSPEVFENIVGPHTQGIGPLSWHEVPCPRSKPIYCHIQGSNQWYAKVIIAGHRNRITLVEIENSGIWEASTRTEDNAWEFFNLGTQNTYKIRITDIFGEVVFIENINPSLVAATFAGTNNFTPCSITGSEDWNAPANITAFPNPTKDAIVFEGVTNITSIEFVNTSGASIHTETNPGYENMRFDVSSFTAGLYLVNFYQQNGEVISKRVSVE